MATGIKIEVLTEKVEARIKQLQAKAQDSTRVFQVIGRVLVNRIRLGFRASRSPWGVPWLPLTSRPGQALVNTGRLLRSIRARAGNGFVEVGTNLKVDKGAASLGAVQHFGAHIVPKTPGGRLVFKINGHLVFAKEVEIPARPFMPINKAGQLNMPPAWSQGILRELGNHFGFGQVTA